MKRLILLAHKPIGERCFRYFLDGNFSNIQLKSVVTNEDSDDWWGSNFIWKKAKEIGVRVISNKTSATKELLDVIKNEKADTLLSVQHPRIIDPEVLKALNYQAFNMHNAKLPRYKGHNSVSHSIINGDKTYTTTLHWMHDQVDSGDIIFEKDFEIGPEDTAKSLYERSQEGSFELFQKFIKLLNEGGPIPRTPMENTEEGRWYKKSDIHAYRMVKNPEDLDEIDRKSRAFYFPPFEPAFIQIRGRKIYLVPKHPYQK